MRGKAERERKISLPAATAATSQASGAGTTLLRGLVCAPVCAANLHVLAFNNGRKQNMAQPAMQSGTVQCRSDRDSRTSSGEHSTRHSKGSRCTKEKSQKCPSTLVEERSHILVRVTASVFARLLACQRKKPQESKKQNISATNRCIPGRHC